MLIYSLEGEAVTLTPTDSPASALRSLATSLILGSDSDCDLVLAQASPRHAQIVRNEHGMVITDLGSAGGTFVNGKRIVRARLVPGDQIKLGGDPDSQPVADGTRTFVVAPIPKVSSSGVQMLGGQSLLQLAVAFGRPGTVISKLEQILEYSLGFGPFDRAAVWVVDPEREGEILHHLCRQAPGHPPAVVSQTILRQVLKGDAMIISDAARDVRLENAMSVKLQNIRTCVALPMSSTERVWGVLYLDSLDPQPLASPEEQEFLSGFASLAAMAVENGWLAANSQKQALLKERLSRFFPPTTVDKILEHPEGRLAGAVLPVTILFCDIRNYTGISFAKPPAKVAAWLDDYFARIVPLVFDNGGTLEKYIGDAMLAIWGAPTLMSPAEQALHSCRAASQIQSAVAEFSAAWRDMPCEVGIGIHHGPAYVGTIGHESYLQYAALGSTTNLAARLCSAAGPGETILSRYLADLLPASEFQSLARPAVQAKGFPDLIEVSLLTPAS
jgi:adenylate cyclase